ncbi:restriction endonuclease [Rhodococcus sp. IEGM 1379]|uniref:McrC family protein n=1 Tax=Rhodococcus sp. IEGM 1379 TaxID=3047086 RepID=UPI0024B8441A|nr:restriction endonuclease [Rhodococcus sp. IEGM 1379]MDI9915411.1 restriction endonuclease [Rhodococcus sp. IEGM 1379]
MNDPTTLTLFERSPCGYGCPGCSLCRPQARLSPETAAALAATGLVTVTPTAVPGVFALATTRKIGAVTVDAFTVRVEPKTPISRLIWMMGFVRDPAWWSQHTALADADTDLVSALAEAFAVAAEYATARGLISGYREVEDSGPVLRGRLRAGDQITRRFGLALPVEIRYDEYDEDIGENQLLLAATLTLLNSAVVPARLQARLARLRRTLVDVTPPTPGAEPSPGRTRLNDRYHWAMQLAELITSHRSIEHRIGNVVVRGFVLDMWKVFEDFLMTTTAAAIARRGGRGVRPGSCPTRYLDHGAVVTIEPDLTWYDAADKPVSVIDAKYKTLSAGWLGPNADMYQLTAYCTALGLREGHLIYAKGDVEPRAIGIIGADVTIYCHALDLALSPADLLTSIDALIGGIAGRLDIAAN